MPENSTNPLITVVIPVLNRETLVMRTLKSIEQQTNHDFKVVLVDNNSTDSTLEVLNKWASEQTDLEVKVVSETAPGAASARNRGLREVDTEWTMFFDSDDVMLPRHLARALETITAHPEADIVGWNLCKIDLDGSRSKHWFYTRDTLYHTIFHGSLSTQRYCARTRIFRGIGGWDNDDFGLDDLELGSRLIQSGNHVLVHAGPEITAEVYVTEDSISGTCYSEGAARFDRSIDAVSRNLPPSLRHWAELKRVILAANCTAEGSEIGKRLFHKALANTPLLYHRMLWHAAYQYTSRKGRGVARLLRPLVTGTNRQTPDPNREPIITVVIPVYNRENLVGKTLKSLESQTYQRFDVVLVDNNSTDGTLDVLRKWAETRKGQNIIVVSEDTPGATAARNRGLQGVKTPWTMFFDSDDVMMPCHVERVVRLIEKHPESDVIGWNICCTDLNGHRHLRRFYRHHKLFNNIFHGGFATQRYCARTDVFRKAGNWDVTVMGWNDIEFGTRILLRCQPKVIHAGNWVTVEAYATSESITGTSFAPGAERFDGSVERMASVLPPRMAHLAQFKRAILAACCAKEGSEKGAKLFEKALANTSSAWHRALLRFVYNYTRYGGRGVARLIMPLI